jgi:hypothetical protein
MLPQHQLEDHVRPPSALSPCRSDRQGIDGADPISSSCSPVPVLEPPTEQPNIEVIFPIVMATAWEEAPLDSLGLPWIHYFKLLEDPHDRSTLCSEGWVANHQPSFLDVPSGKHNPSIALSDLKLTPLSSSDSHSFRLPLLA